MKRTEVKVNETGTGKTIILVAPAAPSIARVAYLTLANRYAPEGLTAIFAGGRTTTMNWDGEQRVVHEFWTQRVNPTKED
jgi:YD repeat-containing protein